MTSTLTQPCLDASSAQMAWLLADLASVNSSATPWVVVTVHQPYVNSNLAHSRSTEGAPIQAAIERVLYESGKVDLLLSGHVHGEEVDGGGMGCRSMSLCPLSSLLHPSLPSCHPPAYERSSRTLNYTCVDDPKAPYYVTIGDGGNREGLASTWETPQPAWSLFRQASYGHGVLTVLNGTSLEWTWFQNPALTPVKLDSFTLTKGVSEPCGSGLTGTPRFLSSLRGAAA